MKTLYNITFQVSGGPWKTMGVVGIEGDSADAMDDAKARLRANIRAADPQAQVKIHTCQSLGNIDLE